MRIIPDNACYCDCHYSEASTIPISDKEWEFILVGYGHWLVHHGYSIVAPQYFAQYLRELIQLKEAMK